MIWLVLAQSLNRAHVHSSHFTRIPATNRQTSSPFNHMQQTSNCRWKIQLQTNTSREDAQHPVLKVLCPLLFSDQLVIRSLRSGPCLPPLMELINVTMHPNSSSRVALEKKDLKLVDMEIEARDGTWERRETADDGLKLARSERATARIEW